MQELERFVQAGIAEGLHLGAQIVVWRHGKVLADLAAGEAAPGQPMPPDALMLWLSSGKPLTATAVGLLVEDGRLSVDDPVARFIPDFAQGGKEGILLRHLMNHTAGLGKALASNWEISDWQVAVARVCQYPLPADWVVGETAAYDAGASWLVLGEVVQRASGTTFEQFLRQRIFTPLGMKDVAFSRAAGDAAIARMAPMFNTHSGEAHRCPWSSPEHLAIPLPGASAHGPARELARFYEALRTGRLLRPQTLALLTSPSRGSVYDHTFRREMDWGLGFLVDNGPDAPYGAGVLTRKGVYGHGGQQSSLAFCEPSRELVVVAIFNGLCGEVKHHKRLQGLMETIAAGL